MWYCYLLYNEKRTYVGISTDPWRRLDEHNSGKHPGAKSTRDGNYFVFGYIKVSNRSIASKLEYRLKRGKGLYGRLKILMHLQDQYRL